LQRIEEHFAMLDLVFVAAGATFLYFCVLYTLACDHL
jgi:hypothetical protein